MLNLDILKSSLIFKIFQERQPNLIRDLRLVESLLSNGNSLK